MTFSAATTFPAVGLILAALLSPAAADPVCPEGPGSCPVSSQALFQSGKQQSMEQMTKILQDKGTLASSLLRSDDLLSHLQAQADSVEHGSKKFTPLELYLLKGLNETLENTTIPAMKKEHADAQEELNAVVQSLINCNNNFDADAEEVRDMKKAVESAGLEHRYCRGNQSEFKKKYDNASTHNEFVVKELLSPSQYASTCTSKNEGLTLPVKLHLASSIDDFFINGLRSFQQKQSRWSLNKAAYLSAKNALENHTKACDSAQSDLEILHCAWLGRASAASKSFGRCWMQASDIWKKAKDAILDASQRRKLEYITTHKIQCLIRFLLFKNVKLSKCGSTSIADTSIFNFTNTTAPNKSNLDELGNLTSAEMVHEGISNAKNATTCNIVHNCGADEQVRSHRCLACEPGKSNSAGDDALGNDTNCSVVLCEANQHVMLHSCAMCAPGMQNSPGDDATGANTSCDPIPCQANQRVSNHSCHACPAGTNNTAGDLASGVDTSCDPMK
jgi:hypothetical protein